MAESYKQFLTSPNSSLLANNATLHYVTTTTSINGATEIIKHLNALQKQVVKKKQNVLNAIDGGRSAAFEVDTSLEFQISGGVYVPGLDDNFLSDRVVHIPVIHLVNFETDQKISQIRIQWDQGALLKQLEVIGRTGRNWPIKDSREQLSLIQSCLKAVGASVASENNQANEELTRTRGSSTNAMRDPHASLHNTATREELEKLESESSVNPYAGASHRPKQRSLANILGEPQSDEEADDSPSRKRSMSPAKTGGSKHFQPVRLFEELGEGDHEEAPARQSTYIKPNPQRFEHFDFAKASEPDTEQKHGAPFDQKHRSKHDSQWSFDDFEKPVRVLPSRQVRYQDVRHWDTDKDALGEQTPAREPGKGRRDAEAHFELQDDGEQVERDPHTHRPRGSVHNEGLGLYKNNLFNADETAGPTPERALGNITNVKNRGKDFEAHFNMTDVSPLAASKQKHVPEARQKAVNMMNANWSNYDESPRKENVERISKTKEDSHIQIAGDGMGGKKGTSRDWLYGEE